MVTARTRRPAARMTHRKSLATRKTVSPHARQTDGAAAIGTDRVFHSIPVTTEMPVNREAKEEVAVVGIEGTASSVTATVSRGQESRRRLTVSRSHVHSTTTTRVPITVVAAAGTQTGTLTDGTTGILAPDSGAEEDTDRDVDSTAAAATRTTTASTGKPVTDRRTDDRAVDTGAGTQVRGGSRSDLRVEEDLILVSDRMDRTTRRTRIPSQ